MPAGREKGNQDDNEKHDIHGMSFARINLMMPSVSLSEALEKSSLSPFRYGLMAQDISSDRPPYCPKKVRL
jgi:hypothetical protein